MLNKSQSIVSLEKLARKIPALKAKGGVSNPDFKQWKDEVETVMKQIFPEKPEVTADFLQGIHRAVMSTSNMYLGPTDERFWKAMDNAKAMLESMAAEIQNTNEPIIYSSRAGAISDSISDMESEKAKQLLKRQIGAISTLDNKKASSPEFRRWKRDTEVALENIFGNSGRHLRDFKEISFSPGAYQSTTTSNALEIACRKGLANALQILESMIDEIDQFGLQSSFDDAAHPNGTAGALPSKLIFISHSSSDKDIADALVDMLCIALNTRVADFLCTSVDGAKLRGGDDTDQVLRREIRVVPAFLSILTPKAMASTYVLFELGARWGIEKSHIPLLAKGAGAEVLKEPLKAQNALRLDHEPDVLQLVYDVASVIGRTPEKPQCYLGKVGTIVRISREGVKAEQTQITDLKKQNKPPPLPVTAVPESLNGIVLSDAAKKLLIEASSTVDGNVSKIHTDSYGDIVNMHNGKEAPGNVEDNRTRAMWVDAFNELVRIGCFEHTEHSGIYRVTHFAYRIADDLKAKEPPGDLIIHSAVYGAGEKFTDVSNYLRDEVANGRRTIPVGNSLLAGGKDPYENAKKALEVEYSCSGIRRTKEIAEGGELDLT